MAGFMSGMAGNVSAFATVWTYDIYRAFYQQDGIRCALCGMGRWCTILGVLISIGTAYLVMQFLAASWTTCRRCSAFSSRRCSAP